MYRQGGLPGFPDQILREIRFVLDDSASVLVRSVFVDLLFYEGSVAVPVADALDTVSPGPFDLIVVCVENTVKQTQ